MIKAKGYAVRSAESKLAPFEFERRDVGPADVLIEIMYCGVCHTDIHQTRNEWGNSVYPMVPGHEIVGRVAEVGAEVTKFEPGDYAGVGCFVDSCGACGAGECATGRGTGTEGRCGHGGTPLTSPGTPKDARMVTNRLTIGSGS